MKGALPLLGAALAGVATGWLATSLPLEARRIVVLAPFLLAAGIDVRTRRIPNALALGATALVLTEAVLAGRGFDAAMGYGGALVVGVALAVVARGGFGIGDVKLLAAAGAAAGISGLPMLLFAVSLAGGALAIAVLVVQRARGATMPYAPAIAAGLLLFSVAIS